MYFMYKGTVYLFKNEYMPNVYKIGMTSLGIEKRIETLRNTSLPADFSLVVRFDSDYANQMERFVHKRLSQYRIAKGREFFFFKSEEFAISVFNKCAETFKPQKLTAAEERALNRELGVLSASQMCKDAGLKSLEEVSQRTKQSVQTLHNWHKNKPELFAIVVDGCVCRRELEKRK